MARATFGNKNGAQYSYSSLYLSIFLSFQGKLVSVYSSSEPRALGELIKWLPSLFIIRCLSTFSEDISETTGPVSNKFHMQPPDKGGKESI